ncbi:MAG: 30S ribosomal protein S4 [bacterium]|nr:30S ribosomal protein S4 [bacterium]
MAKVSKPVCKICRKYGEKLYLKGRRCETAKCPLSPHEGKKKKSVSSLKRKKLSEYGLQLMEKNKVKFYYGVLEQQFRRYFEIAKRKKGVTGENLLKILESRLDNAIYRANWFYSRRMAKQAIAHGEIMINGKRVDRPSYIVKPGNVIKLRPNSKYTAIVKECIEEYKNRIVPSWLKIDNENIVIEIVREPERGEVTLPIDEQLIVNFYSK